jgi:cadmium resistance protein CadD (predicted permease)
MRFAARIGQFLFFLGVLAGIIFYITDQAGVPRYMFLLTGLILIPLGVSIMWRYRKEPEESDRFRTLRRLQSRKGKEDNSSKKG